MHDHAPTSGRPTRGSRAWRGLGRTHQVAVLSWQRIFHVGQGISHDRHGGCVFAQLCRNDLVERIGGGVMIVEIGATVLKQAERRYSTVGHSCDISARGISARFESRGSKTL